MATEQGQSMYKAIKAVISMQADCIKLIEDLEKDKLSGLQPFYGTVVALDLGTALYRRRYVAQVIARMYLRDACQTEMLGLNCCFYDFDNPAFVEPILVAARLTYRQKVVDAGERNLRGWDPWYAFLVWNKEKKYNSPITIENPQKRDTVERVIVAAAPLFSINNLEAASALVDLVGTI
jgi:hypothetical protein